jgi:hypothetical protein
MLVSLGVAIVYYYAPDAEQSWTWITPGSIVATALWLVISLVFKFYVVNFGAYNATYGTIGGVIVLLLWFYLSGLAILAGAELNAEIEHASPYGKEPGEKVPGARKKIGVLAEREWKERQLNKRWKAPVAALAATDRPIVDMPTVAAPRQRQPARASDWLLSAMVAIQAAVLVFLKLRGRFQKVRP